MALHERECVAIDGGAGCLHRARWLVVPHPVDATMDQEDQGLLVCDAHVVTHGLSHTRAVPALFWRIVPLEWGS